MSSDHIAAVLVDTPLLHLDRPFDYRIPDKLIGAIEVGSHVRVRFAGRLLNGWVTDIRSTTEHAGRLADIERVVGQRPVLTPETLRLCQAVAQRWVGTFADVVRSAVPPRYAAAERESPDSSSASDTHIVRGRVQNLDSQADASANRDVFIRFGAQRFPFADGARLSLTVGPDANPLRLVAELVRVALAHGSVLVVLPDIANVAHVRSELRQALDPHRSIAVLTAESGRAARWRSFQQVLAGGVDVVIGTRTSVFAPVRGLRTIILFDDLHDSHREQHAPYWHAREVAALRVHEESLGFIVCGIAESVESAALVERGWLTPVPLEREWLRGHAPRVIAVTEDAAGKDPMLYVTTVPAMAVREARRSLESGPVLVLTPRRGYARRAFCRQCRALRVCPNCQHGAELQQSGLYCTKCETFVPAECPDCGATALRAHGIGQDRIAEELGRACPGVPVVISNMDKPVDAIDARPRLVISTSGCEPHADGGYRAVLILDSGLLLGSGRLDADTDGLRRMLVASSHAQSGGCVVVAAPQDLPVVQALIRWNPSGLAHRLLEERRAAQLPPVARSFVFRGTGPDLVRLRDALSLTPSAQIVNPHQLSDESFRMVVSVPWQLGAETAREVRTQLALYAAHRSSLARRAPSRSDVPLTLELPTMAISADSADGVAPIYVRVDPADF